MKTKRFYNFLPALYGLKKFIPVVIDKEHLHSIGILCDDLPEETEKALITASQKLADDFYHKKIYAPEEIEYTDSECLNEWKHALVDPFDIFVLPIVTACPWKCNACRASNASSVSINDAYLIARSSFKEFNCTPVVPVTLDDYAQCSYLFKKLKKNPDDMDAYERLIELRRGKNFPTKYILGYGCDEPFNEISLLNGSIHKILKEFAAHLNEYPDSEASLEIRTCCSEKELTAYKYEGESVSDILKQMPAEKISFVFRIDLNAYAYESLLSPYASSRGARINGIQCIPVNCRKRVEFDNCICGLIDTDYAYDIMRRLYDCGVGEYSLSMKRLDPYMLCLVSRIANARYGINAERKLLEQYIRNWTPEGFMSIEEQRIIELLKKDAKAAGMTEYE